MKATQLQEETKFNLRSPDILVTTEINSKDVEKLLLRRALAMKDEKIKNLENRIKELSDNLIKAESKHEYTEKKSVIVFVNNYFNTHWHFFSLFLLIGILKIFR